MKSRINLFTILIVSMTFAVCTSWASQADIAVIVKAPNTLALDPDEIRNIFLKKKREFHNGVQAKPVDQTEDQPIHSEFYKKLVSKNDAEMKSYWADLIFTGYASPPKPLPDDTAVKDFVTKTTGGIGFINSESVDSSVKVVYTLK